MANKDGLGKHAVKKGLVVPVSLMALPGSGDEETAARNSSRMREALNTDPKEEPEKYTEPSLHLMVALTTFVATTVMLYFCVDYMVNSISALIASSGLSNTFVGVILLPILNCDFTPIISAIYDEMNATMGYTVGKSIQTALLVTPLTVLLAWWLGIEGVTLVFDGFEVVSLFATVLLLNLIISEGKSSW